MASTNFVYYRREGFPVYSLDRDKKWRELENLLRCDLTSTINKKGEVRQTMHGLALAWNYHPHMWNVRCGGKRTPMEVYADNVLFRRAIYKRAKLGHAATDSGMRKVLRIFSGTQSVSNFRPTAAAALYRRFLPDAGGVVWDMCSGFGGRLLGALACDKVAKYIETDPCTETMDGLREMKGELLPMAQDLGRRTSLDVELHKCGSEVFVPEPNSLDLCFTSPPYFDTEEYSDEPTQSYIKFPTKDSWMNGFMRQTLANCQVGLKPHGTLVINIASVPTYPELEADLVVVAESNGWVLQNRLKLRLSAMPGSRRSGATHKFEPIFVFKKTERVQ